jgi:hypothetical protein
MPEGELTTDPPPLFARVRVEVVEPPPEADGLNAMMSESAYDVPCVRLYAVETLPAVAWTRYASKYEPPPRPCAVEVPCVKIEKPLVKLL